MSNRLEKNMYNIKQLKLDTISIMFGFQFKVTKSIQDGLG
jgi:hypothetical protein